MSCLPVAASHFSSYFSHFHPFSTPSTAPCHLQNTCRCCFSLAFPGLLLHQHDCLIPRVGRAPHGALAKISPLSPLVDEWVQNKLSRNLHSGLHGQNTEFDGLTKLLRSFHFSFSFLFLSVTGRRVVTFSVYPVYEKSCTQLMKVIGAAQLHC